MIPTKELQYKYNAQCITNTKESGEVKEQKLQYKQL